MATHSSVLAWRIPGTEQPGGLPSMGSHRVAAWWAAVYGVAQSRTQLKRLNNLVAAMEKSSFPPFFSFPVF